MSIETDSALATFPNSANGVGVFHKYYNAGDKTIKYLTFTYVPYNDVRDVVSCSVSGKSEVDCRITGPIKPDTKSEARWDVLWYNPTVSRTKISRVHIVYMDDTEEVIEGNNIMNIYDEKSVYYAKHGAAEKKEREERKKKEKESSLTLSYIFFMVFFLIKALKSPDFPEKDKEAAKLHANQGLVLFILEVIGLVVNGIIPVVGTIIIIIAIVFSVLGIMSVKKGDNKELPLIGKIKLLK